MECGRDGLHRAAAVRDGVRGYDQRRGGAAGHGGAGGRDRHALGPGQHQHQAAHQYPAVTQKHRNHSWCKKSNTDHQHGIDMYHMK